MTRLFICLACFVLTAIFSNCKRSSTHGGTIEIDTPREYTWIYERHMDGSVGLQETSPEFVGEKVVKIGVVFHKKAELVSALLTYWRAGERIGVQTIEKIYNETFDPCAMSIEFVLPGSENYGLCEGLYYTYAIRKADPVRKRIRLLTGSNHGTIGEAPSSSCCRSRPIPVRRSRRRRPRASPGRRVHPTRSGAGHRVLWHR